MSDPLDNPEPLVRRVYAYAAYRLGDGPDAEDVTSETFERALRYRQTFDPNRGTPAAWLVGIGAIVAVLASPLVLYRGLAVLVPENWTPIQLHKNSQEIAANIPEPRLVLTLGPLYALEGGCDIYSELSAGSIVYRIADRMSPEERQITHTLGPKTLNDLLAARPPAAVIAGVEPSYFSSLEDPLRQSAPPNWRRQTYGDRLQIYIRP